MAPWIETYRVTLILFRYRFLAMKSKFRWSLNKKQDKRRKATRSKARIGGLVAGIMILFFAGAMVMNSVTHLSSMSDPFAIDIHFESMGFGKDCGTEGCQSLRAALLQPSLVWQELPQLYWLGVMIFLVFMSFSAVWMPLVKINNQTEDNQLEWMATFPVRLRSFLFGRILSEAALNFTFWYFIFPFVMTLLIMRDGVKPKSMMFGLSFCLGLVVMTTGLGLLCEMWMKVRLSPPRQRAMRALLTLLTNPIFIIGYFGFTSRSPWFWKTIVQHQEFLSNSFLNQGLIRLFHQSNPAYFAHGLFAFSSIGLMWILVLRMERFLNQGLYSHSGYESFRGLVIRSPGPSASRGLRHSLSQVFDWVPTMVWREFILLRRDLNYVAQALGLPVVMIGLQYVLRASQNDFANTIGLQLSWVLGIPFFFLMGSSLSLVSREHNALWQLCSAPRKLTSILAERQMLWLSLAYFFYITLAFIVFGSSALRNPEVTYRLILGMTAIWMYESLCRTLSLFFHDPFGVQAGKRISMSLNYIILSLSGVMGWAVGFGTPWSAAVAMTLMLGLTLAFQQKASEYEPFILDPSASPPMRASLSDGLIAALIYFVVQSLVLGMSLSFAWFKPQVAIMWASAIGALFCFIAIRLYYWMKKAEDIPKYLGPVGFRELFILPCLLIGLVAFAKFWVQYAGTWNLWQWLHPVTNSAILEGNKAEISVSLVIFAGLVAPLIEEFIFRGLIFAGMQRLLGLWPSLLLSSLLFAAVYPMLSFGPVFLLGASAAFLYHRSHNLLPSVVLHVLYNLSVLMMT